MHDLEYLLVKQRGIYALPPPPLSPHWMPTRWIFLMQLSFSHHLIWEDFIQEVLPLVTPTFSFARQIALKFAVV